MKIQNITVVFILFMITQFSLEAQVGINILNPDTSAILHLESTDRGLLFPRMNTSQRDAIVEPKAGLMIYNNQDSLIQYYNGDCWLNSFMKDCSDCYFAITPSAIAGTIDRTTEDSISFEIEINQLSGNEQFIATALLSSLPPGINYTINPNPQFSSGTVRITFFATPFAPAGTFPFTFQFLCGQQIINFVYALSLTPCHEINIVNSVNNYNLAENLYALHPELNENIPVCVASYINLGITVTSDDVNNPSFTTGNLHPSSNIAIVNNGNVLGKGGDGGIALDPIQGWDGSGENGGTALELTLPADIINNFNIYGGGGGGNAMAFSLSYTANLPSPIPDLTFAFLIGTGGGGGAGGGNGGDLPESNVIGFVFYEGGTSGSTGQFGINGTGGIQSNPIDLSQGPVSIVLLPYIGGGNGGSYGYPGSQGYFGVTLNISVVINIPFLGPITTPIVNNLNLPIPVSTPAAGEGGYAIKKNGFECNIQDNQYNNSNLKGKVGN